ncbi:LCP family protein [Streptomyces sp. TLI_171]|uniref:LCP family protein n=1 Tax=Streptomyces sp. TLI_171 TaxID=1938859 RepID=UPI000C4CE8EA|nr:LCP family protein [Streptomyces sp. TLI_171]RKE20507.1 LytR family transcriptional attenuator [Streptomyces sp. TLI_171]
MSDGDGEFEVRLGAAFGQAGGGPEPEVTARLVDGGLRAGRRLKRARQRRTVLLAGALTAAVLTGAGTLTAPHGLPGRSSDALQVAGTAPAPSDRGVTILLIGLDTTVGAEGGPTDADPPAAELHIGTRSRGMTDTVMLAHIPAGGREVRQLSLPRDLMVPDGKGGSVQLNQVYWSAEQAETQRLREQGLAEKDVQWRGQEAGRAALISAVQQLAGLPVDHFAEVSMSGFYQVAKALGGVPVCLNEAVDDPWSGAKLPAGRSELNASQALAFVRQRHGIGTGSDIGRTARQQAFLAGVLAKLRAGGTLTDPGRLSALYGALKDDLVVDQGWSPVDFVRQVPAFAAGAGTAGTLPTVFEGNRLRAEDGAAKRILVDGAVPSAAPGGELPSPVALDGVPCVD